MDSRASSISSNDHASGEVRIIPVDGIPEVTAGDPLESFIVDAIRRSPGSLVDGDIVTVTHKVVSKAEGGLIDLNTIEPSALARSWADEWGKDARQVEVVLSQSRRVIRMVRGLIVAETRHGFICANAGVDASNVSADTVCVLPTDPDASCERTRRALLAAFFPGRDPADVSLGVVMTDSFGRPWRTGIVNVAIGVAGMAPLADYRGQFDAAGYELRATVLAVADEIASASELVTHKLAARPVVVVRGYDWHSLAQTGSLRDMVMPEERNLFP